MVSVYITNIRDINENDIDEYLKRLNDQKREKYNKQKKEDDKLRCLASGLLLAEVIGDGEMDFTIRYKDKSKPYIINRPNFSLAHSGDYVLLALAKNEVGCDIQKHKKLDYKKLASRFFHRAEASFLKKCEEEDKKQSFYDIWSLKESYLSNLGKGLYYTLKGFHFVIEGGHIKVEDSQNADHKQYSFELIEYSPDYSLSVCSYSEHVDTDIHEIVFEV